MVRKSLLALLASAAIASNSLADNVQDIRYETPARETVNNDRNKEYDYETARYVIGTLFGASGLIGSISLASKYILRLMHKNIKSKIIETRALYPNLKINLGDGHFHG